MESGIRIESTEFAEILPLWRSELWPERTSPIEPLSAINSAGEIEPRLKMGKALFWRALDSKGEVVGVIGAQPTADSFRSRGLWVKDSCRGRGIGQQLIATVISEARRRGFDRVWTMPRASSVEFYRKVGFVIVKEISGYEYGPHFLAEQSVGPAIGHI